MEEYLKIRNILSEILECDNTIKYNWNMIKHHEDIIKKYKEEMNSCSVKIYELKKELEQYNI